jgi:hypothetical protein
MNEANEVTVRKRYLILNAARLSGAVLLALGLAIIANRFMDLPIEAGYALFAVGVFEFIVLPVILSRRWKTPEQ